MHIHKYHHHTDDLLNLTHSAVLTSDLIPLHKKPTALNDVQHSIPTFLYSRFLWSGSFSPSPNPQAGGPPLVGCHDYFSNIFAITLHIWWSSPWSATWGRAIQWRQGLIYHGSNFTCQNVKVIWWSFVNKFLY